MTANATHAHHTTPDATPEHRMPTAKTATPNVVTRTTRASQPSPSEIIARTASMQTAARLAVLTMISASSIEQAERDVTFLRRRAIRACDVGAQVWTDALAAVLAPIAETARARVAMTGFAAALADRIARGDAPAAPAAPSARAPLADTDDADADLPPAARHARGTDGIGYDDLHDAGLDGSETAPLIPPSPTRGGPAMASV